MGRRAQPPRREGQRKNDLSLPATSGSPSSTTASIFLIVLLSLTAYLPAVRGDFIWDDDAVTQNPLLRSSAGIGKIWSDPSKIPHEDHYWPVTYSTFWIESSLWGMRPAEFHLTNILLHAANSALLYLILRNLAARGAGIAAMLFALHPAHAESVAWIIERKDVLCGFFYLLAALAFHRFQRDGKWPFQILALSLIALAMLSKSTAVTWPIAMLVIEAWRKRKLDTRDIIRLIPACLLLGLLLAVDLRWVRREDHYASGFSPMDRILIASRSLFFSAGKLCWPSNLMTIYPRWESHSWIYLLLIIACLVWLAACRGTRLAWAAAAGISFYVLTLSPTLGFIDFKFMVTSLSADRFQYLACAGIFALMGAGFDAVFSKTSRMFPPASNAVSILLTTILWTLAFRQAALYRDNVTLFEHNVAKNPSAWLAHHNLAAALNDRNEYDAARRHLETAIKLEPRNAEAYSNLGVSLSHLGRPEEAIAAYRKALELKPDYDEAYCNLGIALGREGKFQEAVAYLSSAVALSPERSDLHFNMGVAFGGLGQPENAVKAYRRALELNPADLGAMQNLAMTLLSLGGMDEAMGLLQELVTLAPDLPGAHYDLALACAAKGLRDEAVREAETALRLQPDYTEAKILLAQLQKGAAPQPPPK